MPEKRNNLNVYSIQPYANERAEITIALKYVHLIELFEEFINKIPKLKQILRIERKKNTNHADRGTLETLKSAAAVFRDMYPYLSITLRSRLSKSKLGYHVTMKFGYNDLIKGYSNEYFENTRETEFHIPFKGYVPIKAYFDAMPRQAYLRRIEFETRNSDGAWFYRVFNRKYTDPVFKVPDLYNEGDVKDTTNSNNIIHDILILKALAIHERGGTKWYKNSHYRTIFNNLNNEYSYLNERPLFKEFGNSIRYPAISAAYKEISEARKKANKPATIEKAAHEQKKNVINELKSLPPLRPSGKLMFPGGRNSRETLRRLKRMTSGSLPSNLENLWNSLGLNNKNNTKKRKRNNTNHRSSKKK